MEDKEKDFPKEISPDQAGLSRRKRTEAAAPSKGLGGARGSERRLAYLAAEFTTTEAGRPREGRWSSERAAAPRRPAVPGQPERDRSRRVSRPRAARWRAPDP